MAPLLRDLQHEEFHALLLNAQHRVVGQVLVSRGILDASVVHPREVFKAAVVESAAAIVLVHNHPSGDPSPSAEDRLVTRQMRRAGETLGIPVLDHVIIGDGTWRSVGS
jgi:DNA repair protein RadC